MDCSPIPVSEVVFSESFFQPHKSLDSNVNHLPNHLQLHFLDLAVSILFGRVSHSHIHRLGFSLGRNRSVMYHFVDLCI